MEIREMENMEMENREIRKHNITRYCPTGGQDNILRNDKTYNDGREKTSHLSPPPSFLPTPMSHIPAAPSDFNFDDLDDILAATSEHCYCRGGNERSCDNLCPSLYECGVHYCPLLCHPDPCGPCPYAPDQVLKCQCGKFYLQELPVTKRMNCTDPLPLCYLKCDKRYGCGHKCTQLCHTGPCPPCTGFVSVVCRCGKPAKTIGCSNLGSVPVGGFLCHRRCKESLSCGSHRAVQI